MRRALLGVEGSRGRVSPPRPWRGGSSLRRSCGAGAEGRVLGTLGALGTLGLRCWRARRHPRLGCRRGAAAGEAAPPPLLSKNRADALRCRGLTLRCGKGFTPARSRAGPCGGCEQGSRSRRACSCIFLLRQLLHHPCAHRPRADAQSRGSRSSPRPASRCAVQHGAGSRGCRGGPLPRIAVVPPLRCAAPRALLRTPSLPEAGWGAGGAGAAVLASGRWCRATAPQ